MLLCKLFHLHRDGRRLPLSVDLTHVGGRYTEGQGHHGEGVPLAATIDYFDVATQGVSRVVKIKHAVIKSFDGFFAKGFGHTWRDDRHKVVSANVPDETFGDFKTLDRLVKAICTETDHFVTTHESIVIVEGFQVVEVTMDEGEVRGGTDVLLNLGGDLEVAGQTG